VGGRGNPPARVGLSRAVGGGGDPPGSGGLSRDDVLPVGGSPISGAPVGGGGARCVPQKRPAASRSWRRAASDRSKHFRRPCVEGVRDKTPRTLAMGMPVRRRRRGESEEKGAGEEEEETPRRE
jgi:hypothetical protein